MQIAILPVPGSFVGTDRRDGHAPEFDQLHLIYYVDPETGALLNVNEHQTLTLRSPATGALALVRFDADLIATPASVPRSSRSTAAVAASSPCSRPPCRSSSG